MRTESERSSLAQAPQKREDMSQLLKHHLERHLDLVDWLQQKGQKARPRGLNHQPSPPPS